MHIRINRRGKIPVKLEKRHSQALSRVTSTALDASGRGTVKTGKGSGKEEASGCRFPALRFCFPRPPLRLLSRFMLLSPHPTLWAKRLREQKHDSTCRCIVSSQGSTGFFSPDGQMAKLQRTLHERFDHLPRTKAHMCICNY